MQNSIQITINNCTTEQRDILIAKMSTEGFDNFEEVGEDSLVASIFESSFDEEFIRDLQESFISLSFNTKKLAARNWNEEWEKSFEPIVVDDNVGIRANFHPKNASVKYDLVITPKMSFGTGHHATTHLMVALMQEVDFVNKKVFDFGTGTGVLAILAEKMGASNIMAIDNDAWSVTNTEENILANDCTKIKVIQADKIPDREKAEIVLANITLNVISAHLSAIASILPVQGKLFCSGVLLADKDKLEEVLKLHDFKVGRSEERNGWVACLSTKLG
jgi:ribosomal protein L11 methyltransferase